MLAYKLEKLKNGLTVFAVKNKNLSTLDITLYVKTGSAYESQANNGIAHVLEHLILGKINEKEFQLISNNANAYTNKEFSHYEIIVHKDLFKRSLKLLFGIIQKPDFENADLDSIKGNIASEIDEYTDNPGVILDEAIDDKLYGRNSLALSAGGDKEALARLTIENLKEWYDRFYRPENMILTVVGDVSPKEATEIAEKNCMPKAGPIKKILSPKPAKYPAKKSFQIKIKRFHQAYQAFVFPTAGMADKKYYQYHLFAEILYKKIKIEFDNSEFCYGADFYNQAFFNVGEYRIFIPGNKNNQQKIKLKFNNSIKNLTITEKDFKEVKNFVKRQFLLKQDHPDELSSLTLYMLADKKKGMIKLEDEIRGINKVTFNEIKSIKKKVENIKNWYYFKM